MNRSTKPPSLLQRLSRRRFVEGLGCVGVAGVFGQRADGAPLHAGGASLQAGKSVVQSGAVLTGNRFDLAIGSLPVTFTGHPRVATVVNGMVPGPLLRMRQGDTVTINVTNRLSEDTSIHWHGFRLPSDMDGVPGLSFRGIRPGETFTYRFPIVQGGTYWYHGHSGMQEQVGLYGPVILEPATPAPYHYDREYVVMLSDWTDEDPMTIVANLKQDSGYYNYRQRTLGTLVQDMRTQGVRRTLADRLMWGQMRMSPTDIMDVTGATYTFLVNGHSSAANWTGLFKPGERVRLRFINGASMSTFDVRIPGVAFTVVQADGTDVEPVEVDEFRIGVAETYDVLVDLAKDQAYAIFAQAEDRSGYARATLAPRPGMVAAVPPMDPRPQRTMADMGMAGMTGHDMAAQHDMAGMHDMPGMPGMEHSAAVAMPVIINASGVDPKTLAGRPAVDNVVLEPRSRLSQAGDGLDGNGRRNLTYAQLKDLHVTASAQPIQQEIEFHLTGNMERWTWGFDGKKFSESPPVRVKLGERVRFVLINDTMMEHPIHLHGFLFALENGQGDRLPLKHTINVKPAERVSFVFTADTPGHWAFHCHLLYHMEAGMFRTVVVA